VSLSLLTLLAAASAQQGPPPALTLQDAPGLYVVVRNPPSGGLVALLQAESPVQVTLNDDGAGADLEPGDGVWTGVFEGSFHGLHAFKLRDSRGELLWQDELPLRPDGSSIVTVTASGGSYSGLLEPLGDGAAPPSGSSKAPRVKAAQPESKAAADAAAKAQGTGGSMALAAAAGAGVLGITVGFMGGGLLRRRARLPVVPVTWQQPLAIPALGAVADQSRCWTVPDAGLRAAAAAALAEGLARRGPVLLVPTPGHRSLLVERLRGSPGIYWLPTDRPDPASVLAAAAALTPLGITRVVIDGVDALEAPVKQEAADQVAWELLEGRGARVGVVVLETPERLSRLQADHALERHEDGLSCAGAPVFLSEGAGLVLAAGR